MKALPALVLTWLCTRNRRKAGGPVVLNLIRHELRLARCRLVRSPYYCAAAVACLALGVGLCTTLFAIINAYLLRPLPFEGGDRMAVVAAQRPGRRSLTNMSYPNFADVRQRNRVFDGLVGYAPIHLSLTANNSSDRIWGQAVSGDYFQFLGVQPLVGRTLSPRDDDPSQPPVVVISHGLWRRRFGDDSTIVGKTVRLNDTTFHVIGVMREGFRGTDSMLYADLWVPFAIGEAAGGPPLRLREGNSVRVLGRLKSGVTIAQARSDAETLARMLQEEAAVENRGLGLRVLRERDARPEVSASGQFAPVALLLMSVAVTILGICCANVISLTLARATARQNETSIQLALGATRWGILRQYVFETVMISIAGGVVALAIAGWITAWLSSRQIPGDRPLYLDFRPDARVWGFCLLLSVVAGVAIGSVVSLRTSRAELSTALNEGRFSYGRRRTRLQSSIVVGQFAMLSLLLVICGLLVQSVIHAGRIDLGFRSDGALLLTVDPSERGYDDARGRRLFEELLERLRRVPGVRAVSAAENVPFGPSSSSMPIVADDRIAEGTPVSASYSVVTRDYFSVAGVPITRGRAFDDRDTASTTRVAVINERLAETLWPGREPLMRRFAVVRGNQATEWYQVVGVTKTGKYALLNEPPRDYFYLPYVQVYRSRMTVLLQTDLSPSAILPGLREQLTALDSALAFFDVMTLEERVRSARDSITVGAMLAGGFGMLGALLAGLGLYGLMSYVVMLRARELAIRIGLGANPGAVAMLCVRRGLRLALLGAAGGLLMALAVVPPLRSVLVGVDMLDSATTVAVVGVVLAIAGIASYVPIHRLLATLPVRALLHE